MGKLDLGSPRAGAAWKGRSTRATFLCARTEGMWEVTLGADAREDLRWRRRCGAQAAGSGQELRLRMQRREGPVAGRLGAPRGIGELSSELRPGANG
jgi:hypothetical protein